MKKTNIFLVIGFVITCLSLMSNSGGRAAVQNQGATGAPGETNTCGRSGCHSAGAFNPVAEIRVEDMDGNEITEYFPGATYRVILTNTANGASGYGFQITSLRTSDDSYMGVWSEQSANGQISALTNRTYLEQFERSVANEISANWSVSDMEGGDVTFYAASNAVNGNGSPSGDGTATATLTIPQAVLSNDNIDNINLSLFPNPSADVIHVASDIQYTKYEIYNVLGEMVLNNTLNNNQINIVSLERGTYLVRLSSNTYKSSVKRIIKN